MVFTRKDVDFQGQTTVSFREGTPCPFTFLTCHLPKKWRVFFLRPRGGRGEILQKLPFHKSGCWLTCWILRKKIGTLEKGLFTCQVPLAIEKNSREIHIYIHHVNSIARSPYSRLVGKALDLYDSLPQNAGFGGWQVLVFVQAIKSDWKIHPVWAWMLMYLLDWKGWNARPLFIQIVHYLSQTPPLSAKNSP